MRRRGRRHLCDELARAGRPARYSASQTRLRLDGDLPHGDGKPRCQSRSRFCAGGAVLAPAMRGQGGRGWKPLRFVLTKAGTAFVGRRGIDGGALTVWSRDLKSWKCLLPPRRFGAFCVTQRPAIIEPRENPG